MTRVVSPVPLFSTLTLPIYVYLLYFKSPHLLAIVSPAGLSLKISIITPAHPHLYFCLPTFCALHSAVVYTRATHSLVPVVSPVLLMLCIVLVWGVTGVLTRGWLPCFELGLCEKACFEKPRHAEQTQNTIGCIFTNTGCDSINMEVHGSVRSERTLVTTTSAAGSSVETYCKHQAR